MPNPPIPRRPDAAPRRRRAAAADGAAEGRDGLVFATTGASYTILARKAARSLRQAMPEARIDLFTDQDLADEVFDAIHPLEHRGQRPKMEALRKSRFRRTIYLDADIIVLADISDVFRVLDLADLAAAHAQFRLKVAPTRLPHAFPQINSGVLAVKRSPATRAFLRDWEARMAETGAKVDQPELRRLLYRTDLRLSVLPPEYNLLRVNMLETWETGVGAPRVLHLSRLHKAAPDDPTRPFDVAEALSPRIAAHIAALIASDPSLGGDPALKAPTPFHAALGLPDHTPPHLRRPARAKARLLRGLASLVGKVRPAPKP